MSQLQPKSNNVLDPGAQRRLQKGIAKRVYDLSEDQAIQSNLFREIYGSIKNRFGVSSYKHLRKSELLLALRYIENWMPK